MATYEDLCAAVTECGLPFARIQFDPDDPDGIPDPPFVLLIPRRTLNRMGSNRMAAKFDAYDVELYTHLSDLALERRLQQALEARGFCFQRDHASLSGAIAETVWSTYCDG